ncbi:MAG: hypothetical protein LBQ14_07535 [Treponema sp.]|jgi:hypothetical protein|nr:hypothetical protein [Treponema sp.]
MIGKTAFLLIWLPAFSLAAQTRSFNDIFPAVSAEQRARVFSPDGYIESDEASAGLKLRPSTASGLQVANVVQAKNPSFFVESLLVIPFNGAGSAPNLLDAYNALGRVRNLKGRLYHSSTRGGDIPLFEDATRIESEKKTSPIPDPPGAHYIPPPETVYFRLKDANFGNSYYRTDIRADQRGLFYRLTNFRNLSYGIIPVIREEKFITHLYVEPIAEGLMIYSVSGADVSNFISSRINVSSAIRKRVEVIIDWLVDEVKN